MARIGRTVRISLIAAVLCFITVAAAYPKTTDLRFSVFLNGSWVFPIGVAFHPGAELTLYSFDVNDFLAIDVGGSLTGQIAYANRIDLWSFTSFGGALAPLVVITPVKDSDGKLSFLERMELSLSPGIGINYYIYNGDPAYFLNRDTVGLEFAGFASLRIRLSRYMLIRLDGTYWGRYVGPNIAFGLQLELW